MVEIASVMTSLTSATSTTYQGLNSQPICTTIEGARGCISSCIDDPLILELIRPPVLCPSQQVPASNIAQGPSQGRADSM